MSFFKCQAYGRNASLALFSSLQVSDIDNSEKYLFCIMAFDLGLPGGSDGKASVYNAGDLGSIPGSGRSPGEGNGNPLQYSCLENPMDRGA